MTFIFWQKKNIERSTNFLCTKHDVGLEANTEKTKYIFLSSEQDAGQNYDRRMENKSFENDKSIRNQNYMLRSVECRENTPNACFHSFLNILSLRWYLRM